MKTISSIIFVLGVAALSTALLGGCRAEECQKMARCCEAIEDHEAVGSACGELAEGVKDPETCRTILLTVDAMFEDRGETVPEACQ